jgi:hypothetical protein
LRKENDGLRDEIKGLRKSIDELTAPIDNQPKGIPSCPNCSTAGKEFFMRPIPADFVDIENATHECSKCGFKIKV